MRAVLGVIFGGILICPLFAVAGFKHANPALVLPPDQATFLVGLAILGTAIVVLVVNNALHD